MVDYHTSRDALTKYAVRRAIVPPGLPNSKQATLWWPVFVL